MLNAIALFGVWLAGAVALNAIAPQPASGSADPAVAGVAAEAAVRQPSPVRLWIDDGTDIFYPGDPVQLRLQVAEDAYVAVLHIATDGTLDVVLPTASWSGERVRGQRVYTLPGPSGRFALGRTPGIGYFYAVASPFPLDLRALRSARDGWGVGRLIRGDPFWAMERITELLVRDLRLVPYGVDIASYHIGGRHRYPSFACHDRMARADFGAGWAYYPSCDRLQRLLVTHPYYYDTRRFRGERATYLRELDDLAPRHGFKEDGARGVPFRGELDRTGNRGRAAPPPVLPSAEQGDPASPTRQRPTLERRLRERADPPPARERPQPRDNAGSRERAPEREEARPAPRRPPPEESPPRDGASRR